MTGTRARIDELLAEARGIRDPARHAMLTNEARALIALVHADAAEALVSATLAGNLEPLPRYAEIGEVELLIDDARLDELASIFRAAWNSADRQGRQGNRVREGLHDVLRELKLLPPERIAGGPAEPGHVSTDPDEREEESIELVDPAESDYEEPEHPELDAALASLGLELRDGVVDAAPKHDPIAAALAEDEAATIAEETTLERLRRLSTEERK